MRLMLLALVFIGLSAGEDAQPRRADLPPWGEARAELDPALPAWVPRAPLADNLNEFGTDTMNNIMTLWAEAMLTAHPRITVQIEGKGGSTAPSALIERIAHFGTMARRMRPAEVAAFVRARSYPPTEVVVAADALAVYVHRDNPIDHLTLAEIDALFSAERRRCHPPVQRWRDLVRPDLALPDLPVTRYGRNSGSGAYGHFRETVMQRGPYHPEVRESPSGPTLPAVARDAGGIAYSGAGGGGGAIRAVPIAVDAASPPIAPVPCDPTRYPLGRLLYIYLDLPPDQAPSLAVAEFLRLVLSRVGQEIVAKDGLIPLPAAWCTAQRTWLGL